MAPTECEFSVAGSSATDTWSRAANDNAPAFIVRRSRDGGAFGWTGRALPPETEFAQPTLSSASTYAYRVETRGTDGSFSSPTACMPPQVEGQAERVLHISIDGLRSDSVDAVHTQTLWQLINQGASTLNARACTISMSPTRTTTRCR